VTVSVENGTGAYEQATTTGTALSALGFKVLSEGDVTPTGDVSETVVYYGSKSPSTEAAAEKVARSMSGAVIMAYAPSQVVGGATVTVVTGTQFAVNPPTPAAPATSSTATGNSAATTSSVPVTTTTTTSSGSSAIEAASPATSGLEPWDPRGCPVGAPVTAPVANLTF